MIQVPVLLSTLPGKEMPGVFPLHDRNSKLYQFVRILLETIFSTSVRFFVGVFYNRGSVQHRRTFVARINGACSVPSFDAHNACCRVKASNPNGLLFFLTVSGEFIVCNYRSRWLADLVFNCGIRCRSCADHRAIMVPAP